MQWTRASVLGFAVFFYDTQMHGICGTKNLGPTINESTYDSKGFPYKEIGGREHWFKRNHSLPCCSFADRILNNFFRRFLSFDLFQFRHFYFRHFSFSTFSFSTF